MRRTSIMTLGFVLIFIGLQLNLVETYVLTPRVTNFLSENGPQIEAAAGPMSAPGFDSPYYQASYPGAGTMSQPPRQPMMPRLNGPKTFSPPPWMCWPILFLGTVVFLHGLSTRRD